MEEDELLERLKPRPVLAYITRWSVTVPLFGCLLLGYWATIDSSALKDAMVGIAVARWGSVIWVCVSLILLAFLVISCALFRFILKQKNEEISKLVLELNKQQESIPHSGKRRRKK